MDKYIGYTYPVWWDTGDNRPAGSHRAIILGISPYSGAYPEMFDVVLRLSSATPRGWTEMTGTKKDVKLYAEPT